MSNQNSRILETFSELRKKGLSHGDKQEHPAGPARMGRSANFEKVRWRLIEHMTKALIARMQPAMRMFGLQIFEQIGTPNTCYNDYHFFRSDNTASTRVWFAMTTDGDLLANVERFRASEGYKYDPLMRLAANENALWDFFEKILIELGSER